MDLDDRQDGLVSDQTAKASTSSPQNDPTDENKPSVMNGSDSSAPLDDNGNNLLFLQRKTQLFYQKLT